MFNLVVRKAGQKDLVLTFDNGTDAYNWFFIYILDKENNVSLSF